ncbi:MAG: VOC family protein [Bacteroidota bacterium]|nr:VOC family protein [Flavisolibacter sp.]MDQ3846182.1 VOC family protein [Bacteroidota bacterium]MBD0297072.1 VOC family protein [Flavisolibacter sp.]MBD0352635.1 VOC family protein [Flavisolibacter sp.]MBD0368815.1 VOC family protein [Flavisolibacter sp.]
MAINPQTTGIHHIALRCKDFAVTKDFYQNRIGLPLVLDTPDLIGFMAGTVFVGFRKAEPKNETEGVFSPFRVGLDHVAMTCESEEELHRFAKGLADAGVENTGVKKDETLQKLYVAFKDPDRIQWEFYMV